MTRLFTSQISLDVEANTNGEPRQFRWQDRVHTVLHIKQMWQIDTDWWTATGRISRRYFALTTQSGLLCVIFRDQLSGAWFLSSIYD